MDSPNPQPAQPDNKLRWYQYRLRSLFVLTTLVAFGMSWVAVKKEGYRRQHDAAAAIEKMHGSVMWAPKPGWFGKLLRDDSLRDVTEVHFASVIDLEDADLAHVEAFSGLKRLVIMGGQITDAGLRHLQDLRQLEDLNLSDTKITDAGLRHLQDLRQLEYLDLSGTKITDAGLVHLQGLHRLRNLALYTTQVSDRGIEKLRQALTECAIYSDYDPLTTITNPQRIPHESS
jgi:hypothetical protein